MGGGAATSAPDVRSISASLHQLQADIKGKVVINDRCAPSEPPLWNSLLRGPSPVASAAVPCCYVHAACEEDVVHALRCAVQLRMRVHPRGSGHHYAGTCLAQGGMVIDLAALNQLIQHAFSFVYALLWLRPDVPAQAVDPDARLAHVGPGASGASLGAALAPHHLHCPLPHISHVGLGGFITGGGNGWGSPQWGAACDSVVRMRAVIMRTEQGVSGHKQEGQQQEEEVQEAGLPDVCVVEVDAQQQPELFCGLCGGGAFLGIVTHFTLCLHPVPASLPCITAMYPLEQLQAVAQVYRLLLDKAPSSVEPSMCLMHASLSPPLPTANSESAPAQAEPSTGNADSQCVNAASSVQQDEPQALVCLACHGFVDRSEGALQAAFDMVRQCLPQQRVMLLDGPVPYLEAVKVLDDAWSWQGLCMYGHGSFLLPDDALQPQRLSMLQQAAAAMPSKRSSILLCPSCPRHTLPASGSAMGFRGNVFVALYAMWGRTQEGPAADGDEANVAWLRDTRNHVAPAALGCYINEVMGDEPGQVQRCYEPEAYARLCALKALYDPMGLLRSL